MKFTLMIILAAMLASANAFATSTCKMSSPEKRSVLDKSQDSGDRSSTTGDKTVK